MARPYWSGQFQLSLVSFGIQLYSASEAKSEIHFHQLSRKTGERIKHQNVTDEDSRVEKDEIVKGYEYSKGEYVMVEQEDIDNLRIPSRQTLSVEQFVDRHELDLKFFERPYFVTPDGSSQAEAFAVVRKAMQSTSKVALGKIAFGGREHLIALVAPNEEDQLGLMAYTMRYAEELRDASEYFGSLKAITIDKEQLELAKELIERKVSPFDPSRYSDKYDAALRAMVEAKIKHAPLPKDAPAPKSTNVISLMDALRKSVQSDRNGLTKPSAGKKSSTQSPAKTLGSPPATTSPATGRAKSKPAKSNAKRRTA